MKRREGERWREKQIPDIYVTNKTNYRLCRSITN